MIAATQKKKKKEATSLEGQIGGISSPQDFLLDFVSSDLDLSVASPPPRPFHQSVIQFNTP